jgi:hypothetical protein
MVLVSNVVQPMIPRGWDRFCSVLPGAQKSPFDACFVIVICPVIAYHPVNEQKYGSNKRDQDQQQFEIGLHGLILVSEIH